ncbi:ACP phosphodiesterase [Algoriphagus sanaruensis]|uniref:ACP phosphodiesterase n=1 Tax=Algoriphagus sanaruensis TaxID=1727163 RepID=A0A142EMN6_9BACT|nr:ACP phosphodiesterase [Algoriphagus sanaruensis]AMQ56391.1 ACP phosphodiesterase [Algoriphagus sanaruensis]
MNFLAHAYLSFDQEKILVGNFAADFIKGRDLHLYEEGIQMGIMLHREIDTFTDTHPLVKAGQSYLRPKFRHYSTVISDIFFDYFLAKNWSTYSNQPLENFAIKTYDLMEQYHDQLPEDFNQMLNWMKNQNWLVAYGSHEGIQRALNGLTRRSKFDSKMNEATAVLKEKEQEFEVIFFAFFEDLRTFAREKLTELQKTHGRH